MTVSKMADATARVSWGTGPIGEAVQASYDQRVMQFIVDQDSEPLQFFSEEMRACSNSGDWYGEHAGKWLTTAGYAYRRTGSEELAERIRSSVAFLSTCQEPDGYLGTYSQEYEGRLSHERSAQVRTWDIWVHAWLILGLLQVADVPGVEGAVEIATRIGNLVMGTFSNNRSILDLGNHQGLSSAVIIQPLAELSMRTGNPEFATFAIQILQQMEDRGMRMLTGQHHRADVTEIGTGKAYQLCWVLTGLAALYRATQRTELIQAAEYWWENIKENHLTPMGGPWGGIATHKEVFNAKGFFSPFGLTETCSTSSWMSLCRELFSITGKPRYVEAFEASLSNALLGAMDANGRDWCYFTFPNGRRNNTYHWACCKSSGAMALEEAQAMAVTSSGTSISINLWHSFEAELNIGGQPVKIQQAIDRNGQHSQVALELEQDQEFTLTIRIPGGSKLREIWLNDELYPLDGLSIQRNWQTGDTVKTSVDFQMKVHLQTYTLDHHGQEIVRTDFACLTWGPYVYATGLIDGYKKEETLRLARLTPESSFALTQQRTPGGLPLIHFVQPGRPPIPFSPYFEAGGRHDGAWRATWIQVAWQ